MKLQPDLLVEANSCGRSTCRCSLQKQRSNYEGLEGVRAQGEDISSEVSFLSQPTVLNPLFIHTNCYRGGQKFDWTHYASVMTFMLLQRPPPDPVLAPFQPREGRSPAAVYSYNFRLGPVCGRICVLPCVNKAY